MKPLDAKCEDLKVELEDGSIGLMSECTAVVRNGDTVLIKKEEK